MPEVSLSVVLAIVVAIFSSGITWGVMVARAKAQEDKHKTSDHRIDETIDDLKEAVKELRGLTTELQVMKASNLRNEKDIEDHEKRIAHLEIMVAKLQYGRS